MTAPEVAGVAVIGIGLLMMLIGSVIAIREGRRRGTLGGAADFITALKGLVSELAGKNVSLVFFTFGTLLVFLGGVIVVGGDLLA